MNSSQFQTFWHMIIRTFLIYKPNFKDKVLNAAVWVALNITVFGLIMPTIGLHNFGPFMLISTTISQGFFTAVNNIASIVTEINETSSNLQYELTLPISSTKVFVKYALELAYQGFITSMLIFPMGLLLLNNEFSFQYFLWGKFYLIQIIACTFSGFFALWIASFTKDIYNGLENFWLRIIFPLWFLGGFQFSWKNLFSIAPKFAYINLFNPLTYALEGGRAAALDPALSLPYWNCIGALTVFTMLFGYLGIKKLKKRLDCL